MNTELSPFKNGEYNFESPSPIDHAITPLTKEHEWAKLGVPPLNNYRFLDHKIPRLKHVEVV